LLINQSIDIYLFSGSKTRQQNGDTPLHIIAMCHVANKFCSRICRLSIEYTTSPVARSFSVDVIAVLDATNSSYRRDLYGQMDGRCGAMTALSIAQQHSSSSAYTTETAHWLLLLCCCYCCWK